MADLMMALARAAGRSPGPYFSTHDLNVRVEMPC